MRDKEKINKIKDELKGLTGELCRTRINEEYALICERMIDKMARKRNVPFLNGKRKTWAAAVVYSIGQINFLFDPSFEPYMEGAEICSHFDVSRSTVTNKAKMIREMFKMNYFESEFSTERSIEENPLKDMVMLKSGLIITKDHLREIIIREIVGEDGGEEHREVDHKADTVNPTQEDRSRDKKQRSLFEY